MSGVRSKHMRQYMKTLGNTLPTKSEQLIKEHVSGMNVVVIPAGFRVFHGTTSQNVDWLEDIKTNHMSKALRQHFFIADKQTASKYGTQTDTSRIVAAYDPSRIEMKDKSVTPQDIIPLYYVPGPHGVDLELEVIRPLRLINMNDKKTLRTLVLKAKEFAFANDTNEDYRRKISYAFAELQKNPSWNPEEDSIMHFYLDEIKKVRRNSIADYEFFAEFMCKQLPQLVDIHFDGWIYFGAEKDSTFHGELMLCNPRERVLRYITLHTVPDTVYPSNLMSIDTFRRSVPSYIDLKHHKFDFIRKGYIIPIEERKGGGGKQKNQKASR
jgi:hypothetical protein